MKILSGGGRRSNRQDEDPEVKRKKLLATIHIAKTDMGWSDNYYRSLLESCFDVSTSAALSIVQLEALVAAIRNRGWKPKKKTGDVDEQVLAFRSRIKSLAAQIPDGQERLKGLCRVMCGCENINWCNSTPKMKRLLAALGNILRRETEVREAL